MAGVPGVTGGGAGSGEVLIAGGGIGGLSAAVALDQAGIPVRVFEQAPELREVGAGVSLWPNAVRALARLGLDETVRGRHVALREIVVRRASGTPLMRLRGSGLEPEPGVCVHRAHLQQALAARVPANRLELDRRVVGFESRDGGVTLHLQGGEAVPGRLVIGCDGIHSVIRSALHGGGPPRRRGYRIWRGVADLLLDEELLQRSTEWWGPGRRFGILPGEPGRVFWYATHTTSAPPAAGDADPGRLVRLFADWPAPVRELIEASGHAIVRTEAEDRPVPRRWGRGPVTLLGDAAHPMTPNMGQGACTALEDAVVLARCLAEDGAGEAALRRYERLRARRTRWIVRQSRRIGRIAQLRSPLLGAGRDGVMRLLPDRLTEPPQRRLYGYSP